MARLKRLICQRVSNVLEHGSQGDHFGPRLCLVRLVHNLGSWTYIFECLAGVSDIGSYGRVKSVRPSWLMDALLVRTINRSLRIRCGEDP